MIPNLVNHNNVPPKTIIFEKGDKKPNGLTKPRRSIPPHVFGVTMFICFIRF